MTVLDMADLNVIGSEEFIDSLTDKIVDTLKRNGNVAFDPISGELCFKSVNRIGLTDLDLRTMVFDSVISLCDDIEENNYSYSGGKNYDKKIHSFFEDECDKSFGELLVMEEAINSDDECHIDDIPDEVLSDLKLLLS